MNVVTLVDESESGPQKGVQGSEATSDWVIKAKFTLSLIRVCTLHAVMEPELLSFHKTLTNADVKRNFELSNKALYLPASNGVLIVRDVDGIPYRFRAPKRRSGRRSLTQDWKAFAVAKELKVVQKIRMYRLGHGNEYVMEVRVQLFGKVIGWPRL
ncbi:unnamed protein product [Ilex paraguariensis]|uniref:TF-B3 domain-containing protein n=1 Tax=Ilex paraguariensis TaxID=185542 RepID=A0ABC8QUH1_9AQUA